MSDGRGTSSLRDYLRIGRRRKWAIVQGVVLVPLAAVLFALHQERLYQASAEVLLSRQNLAAALTGTDDPAVYQQADRVVQTQADLARVPAVAQRVLATTGLREWTPRDLLEASSVVGRQNADLLEFRVRHGSPALAARLATEYARQFTAYRRSLDTAALENARRGLAERISALAAAGEQRSDLYASLVEKDEQLRTMQALQTSNAFLVRPADDATQVQPRPVRNGVLGLALGLVLGIAFAFLWEALDTRVRSAEEVVEELEMPLLARLPEPPRRLRNKHRLVMLADRDSLQAEAFRMLRTNLEFVNLERHARVLMVTSAVQGEGKSTTVANLAVALARAGRRVVLVDLDLRRPFLDRFFDLEGRPGVTDVALGRVELDRALVPLAIARSSEKGAGANGNGNGNGSGMVQGTLDVLPAGSTPPDPGEFVGTRTLAGIIDSLRERADFVLVDSPPLLRVGDALTLSARIDGLVVVGRLDVLRRPMLVELARVLEASPAAALGFVLTGATGNEGYGYGYGGAYGYGSPARAEKAETLA